MKCKICNYKINIRDKGELRDVVMIKILSEDLEKLIEIEYEHVRCRNKEAPNLKIRERLQV
jgi:hypothetical protein